jgi:Putative prokaryotic signal transducing protein
MHDAELVIVHAFGNSTEADIAKSALEAAGIDAMIQADTAGGTRPHLAWAGTGFRILVRADDAPAARDILDLPAQQMP